MLERYEKLIHQGELPRLRIVPLSSILFHEETEPARLRRVAARLEQDGVLRHPPIVAGSPTARSYLLLDGAHRTLALQALGIRHVLVQVVDYADRLIELDRWHHLLDSEDPDRFIEQVRKLPGIAIARQKSPADGGPVPLRRSQYAQIILRDRSTLVLHPADGRGRDEARWLDGAAPLLRALVRMYKERGFLDRISYDEFDWLATNYQRFTALVVFPQFSKKEIQRIARSREKLPAGITRHRIPKRALRFNLPLWVLARNLSTAELNRRLVEMILDRTQSGRIRFYAESTFSFDE
jgi:hypothetical protein